MWENGIQDLEDDRTVPYRLSLMMAIWKHF